MRQREFIALTGAVVATWPQILLANPEPSFRSALGAIAEAALSPLTSMTLSGH